jgi:hypothetical protein
MRLRSAKCIVIAEAARANADAHRIVSSVASRWNADWPHHGQNIQEIASDFCPVSGLRDAPLGALRAGVPCSAANLRVIKSVR